MFKVISKIILVLWLSFGLIAGGVSANDVTKDKDYECAKYAVNKSSKRWDIESKNPSSKVNQLCLWSYDYYKDAAKRLKIKGKNKTGEMPMWMSDDEALDILESDIGMSLIDIKDKKMSWYDAIDYCLKNNQLLPSLEQIKVHKGTFDQYLKHRKISALKKFGRPINEDNMNWVSKNISSLSFFRGKFPNKLYVIDEKDAVAYMHNSGGVIKVGSRGSNAMYDLACFNSTVEKVSKFKDLHQKNKKAFIEKEEKLRKKYYTETAIDYLQMVVENKDNLNELNKYHNGVGVYVGSVKARFKYGTKQTLFGSKNIFYSDIYYFKDTRLEVSDNIFTWAIKADAGSRSGYQKRISGKLGSSSKGLTGKGFNDLIEYIKKSKIFKALHSQKAVEEDYKVIVSGSFEGKQGNNHLLSIEIGSTYMQVFIY